VTTAREWADRSTGTVPPNHRRVAASAGPKRRDRARELIESPHTGTSDGSTDPQGVRPVGWRWMVLPKGIGNVARSPYWKGKVVHRVGLVSHAFSGRRRRQRTTRKPNHLKVFWSGPRPWPTLPKRAHGTEPAQFESCRLFASSVWPFAKVQRNPLSGALRALVPVALYMLIRQALRHERQVSRRETDGRLRDRRYTDALHDCTGRTWEIGGSSRI